MKRRFLGVRRYFSDLPDDAKWMLAIVIIAAILTVLALVMPSHMGAPEQNTLVHSL